MQALQKDGLFANINYFCMIPSASQKNITANSYTHAINGCWSLGQFFKAKMKMLKTSRRYCFRAV